MKIPLLKAFFWSLGKIHIFPLQKKEKLSDYQPIVLITGCASGIGLALAEILYWQTQYRVVATAREKSLDKIKEHLTETERFMIAPLDVTSEESRHQLLQHIKNKWGDVDILVNNAGISYRSVVEHMTENDEQLQMKTNYLGPIGLIRDVLPALRDKGRGKIINVSSVSGMLAMPTMASYSASKYALEGASEALWYEMRPLGISVSLIQPGFVHSSSFKNVYYSALSDPKQHHKGPYYDYYYYMTPFVEKMMSISRSTPEKIAQIILKAIQTESPPLWIPATPDAIVFYYLRRLLPRRFFLPFLFYCLPKAHLWAQSYTHKRK